MISSDIFFIGVSVLSPLILLLALRLVIKYSASMIALLFFLGPFAGAWALATVGELAKPKPVISRIPWTALFFYLFGLTMFGLWIADLGVIGFWWSLRVHRFKQISATRRIVAGAGLGSLIGPILSFALWALFLPAPNFPTGDKVSQIIHDPISLINVGFQGVLAGAVCGMIVACYIGKEIALNNQRQLADG